MSSIGVAIDGRATLTTIAEQARVAETGGADTLWVACHLFLRDPITTAHVALAATTRLKVALMAMSPYATHPVFIAMAAAALAEFYPGRVILCLGVGAPGDRSAAGIMAPQPLATLHEAITLCRTLFAGETIRHQGARFQVTGRRLAGAPCAIPIVLAASGPRMLELAGAAADGVLLSSAASVPFVCRCLDTVARGAAGRTLWRCGIVYTCMASQGSAALTHLRRALGFILRGAHHARNLQLAGTQLDQQRLYNAYAQEDWPTVERLITDDLMQRHAAIGTAEHVLARFAEYRAAGLDQVIIGGMDTAAGLADALHAVQTLVHNGAHPLAVPNAVRAPAKPLRPSPDGLSTGGEDRCGSPAGAAHRSG
jgi:5,10-methylenetetrahydromethanopterin reductase